MKIPSSRCPEFLATKAAPKATDTKDIKDEVDGLPDIMTRMSEPKALFSAEDAGISVGDQITIRYLDGTNQTRVFTLSDERNDPGKALIAVWEPLGDVLQGAGVGDEVEFDVGGQTRSVRVEKIEKPGVTA